MIQGTKTREGVFGVRRYRYRKIGFKKMIGGLTLWTVLGITLAAPAQDYWKQIGKLSSTRITVLAVNSSGHIFAGTQDDGLWRSTHRNGNWKQAGTDKLGSYISTFAINRNGDIFVGTSTGVFRSSDGGTSWIAANTGLPTINSIAIDSNDVIIVSTIDKGIFRSKTNGESWQYLGRFDLYAFKIVATLSGHFFLTTNCCLNVGNWMGSIHRSSDGGDTWQAVYRDPPSFTGSLIMDISSNAWGDVFAASLWNGIIRSTDNGASWSVTNSSLTNVNCLAVNSRGYFFAGQQEGEILYSPDRGETWTRIGSGLMNNRIWSIAFDANDLAYAGDDSGRVFRSARPTVIENSVDGLMAYFTLAQNHPNPFNPSTTISFSLPRASFVTLKIYNLLGEETATLMNEQCAAGEHRVQWQPQDLPSGVYVYRLQAQGFSQSRKLVLLR